MARYPVHALMARSHDVAALSPAWMDGIVSCSDAANLLEPADGPLKFLLVAAPRGHHHHSLPEMACPMSVQVRGGIFGACSPHICARGSTANNHEKPFKHEYIRRLPTGAAGERRIPPSKGRAVTRPLSGRRGPAESGDDASFFRASLAPRFAGLRCGETVAPQAIITLHRQRNLLVLWALAGWVWRV